MIRSHQSCDGRCALAGPPMDRRSFLSAAAAASVTLALVACGDRQIGGITGPPMLGTGSLTINVNDFAALAPIGGVARVTTTGAPIAVYHSGPDTYAAYSMACPHAGTTVSINASGFTCPNHGARFAKDGTWTGGQSSARLAVVPTTYDPATGVLTLATSGTPVPTGGDDDDDDDDDDDGTP